MKQKIFMQIDILTYFVSNLRRSYRLNKFQINSSF